MNPSAQRQITQYAASVTDLFKLMTEGKEAEFADRVHSAGRFVFGDKKDDVPRLLRDDLLDQFSLSGVPQAERVPNNQLALLSMVDCWWKLGLNPYDHMICSTPVYPRLIVIDWEVFRLWLGITEYLYRQPGLLDECIHVAIHDNTFRRDDLEFTFAARVPPLETVVHDARDGQNVYHSQTLSRTENDSPSFRSTLKTDSRKPQK